MPTRRLLPPRQCKATARSGQRCQRYVGAGGAALVCASHGGNAPQVKRAAERRYALAEAKAFLERRKAEREAEDEALEDPLTVDDVVALLDPRRAADHLLIKARAHAATSARYRRQAKAILSSLRDAA